MARKPRIHNPGAVYHVILRGNARQDIFFDAEDYCRFLQFLQDGIERYGFRVHGYCLMTNHLHLAIQVGEIPLSRIMQNLSLRYTKWINWTQGRIGHLFQGRYKAIMVEANNYLSQLVAYLHLNPVRAGVCVDPVDYPWSSHRAYLGITQSPWLTTSFVLSPFSPNPQNARQLFREFVGISAEDGHRPEFHGKKSVDGRVFGDDTFVEDILRNESAKQATVTIDHVLAAVHEVCGLTPEEMKSGSRGMRVSTGRALAAWGVLNLCDGTMTELGRNVGRDVTSLSSAVKRLVYRSKMDDEVLASMTSVKEVALRIARLQA